MSRCSSARTKRMADNMGDKASEVTAKKRQLRKEMRQTLSDFQQSPLYKEYSRKAELQFLNSALYKEAPLILAFVSLKTEIDTHHLLEEMLKDKKRLAIPETKASSMTFRLLKEGTPLSSQVRIGSYSIEEPLPELEKIEAEDVPPGTVILVPGLAFSREGARLGKGKGYYDNYISLLPKGIRLAGYAFSFQITGDVPCEAHDKKVDCLITEDGFYSVK